LALSTQLFQQFPWQGGVNTSVDKGLIPVNQLVQADNVIFDTRGSRKKREGINFDFDDGSTSTDEIIGLVDFFFGLAKTHRIVGVTAPSAGGASVFSWNPSDGARTTLTVDGTAITTPTTSYWEVLNNRAILGTDGASNVLKSWDGTNNVKDLGEQESATILCVADVADSLDATFFVLQDVAGGVAFWFDVDDSGTTIPAGASAENRAIEITTIVTNDSAATVAAAVQVAIDADGQFSATVLTDTVTATAFNGGNLTDFADGDAGFTFTATDGISPPKGQYLSSHLGRLWTNDKTNKDRLHYSSTANVDQWLGFGDSGAIDIGVGDGDPDGITAIFPTFKGQLFVAKQTKLYRITGFFPETFQVELISSGIGCISHNSIAQIDQSDMFFLSERGVHSLAASVQFGDFDSTFVSTDIQKTINDDWLKSRLKFSWGAYLNEINSYALAVTDEDISSVNNQAIWLYNIPGKSWYRWGTPSTGVACASLITVNDTDQNRFYLGSNTTKLAQTQTGTRSDTNEAGTSLGIILKVKTGQIFPDKNPYTVKGFKRFALIYTPSGTHTVTIKFKIDDFDQQSLVFSATNAGDLLGSTFVLGQSVLGSSFTLAPNALTIDGYGRSFQVTIEQSGTDEELEIQGFTVEYDTAGTKQETTLTSEGTDPV